MPHNYSKAAKAGVLILVASVIGCNLYKVTDTPDYEEDNTQVVLQSDNATVADVSVPDVNQCVVDANSLLPKPVADTNAVEVRPVLPEESQESPYLAAVVEFANNVLKYGKDTYGPENTPLFVDGLHVDGLTPVKWISPKGDVLTATETEEWILCNFASQQTLLRTLVGLSKITGDPKYHNAATQAVKYAFENLRSDNGLFYWGNAAAYDVQADKPYSYNGHHTIKIDYPYYELMWQVDARATREVIEAFWSAHILDWSNLDMNRYGFLLDSIEAPWNYEYKRGPVPFKGKGHGFITTGTSLAHAAALLSRLSGQEEPLVWSKRLTQRYVDTRDPKIGISAYAFNYSIFMCRTFPVLPFKYRYLDYPEERHVHPWLSVLLIGQMLGEKGNEFTQWALEELTAWGKVSYRRKDNSFVPMIIDGTNLEGYVLEEGPIGLNIAKPCPAGPQYFWAFCVAYHETGDEFMWQMVRDIALGNDFGDIGRSPGEIPELKTKTTCSHVYGLLGFLQLYEKTNNRVYLEMARRIGDNILINKFHKGFFVPSKRHIYTRFDCFEPLALLHLEAAIKPTSKSIPTVWPSLSLFRPAYRYRQEGVDRLIIYTLTESSKPPLSLQEAVAIGDFKLVKTLLEGGTDVNVLDDTFFKTALHRAAISGHREIAEFLLAKGASIDVRSSASDTALHYAVEQGHTKIVELLIANDADVNVKNNDGQTPLHYAAELGLKDIAELLIANEADINAENNNGQTPLHKAAIRGHKDVAELLIDNGADVNATDQVGYTPLHYAVWSWDTETAGLLIEKGADVNAKNRWDWTPLHYAANGDNRGMAYLLIVKGGADVNAKNNSGGTALSVAKGKGHTEMAELLRKCGAKENGGESSTIDTPRDTGQEDKTANPKS